MDLIPRDKLPPGRRRSVTANAWIARREKGGNYHSHVYLGGKGRVKILSTSTTDHRKALEFNRCHLLHELSGTTPLPVSAVQHQAELLEYFGGENLIMKPCSRPPTSV